MEAPDEVMYVGSTCHATIGRITLSSSAVLEASWLGKLELADVSFAEFWPALSISTVRFIRYCWNARTST